MRCRETGKLRLRVVMKSDFINRKHEVSSGLCSLEIKIIVQNTEMEVTKSLELVVMRVSVKQYK